MHKDISLDGIWNFGFGTNSLDDLDPNTVILDSWMTVPGCFEALSKYFGLRGIGVYQRSVQCAGKVKLTLEALGLRGKVFWDGRLLGYCEHPFSREEFTFDAGNTDSHLLTIAVENLNHPVEKGTLFVEDYDFYGYGGIYDSVILTELPEYHVERLQLTTPNLSGDVQVKLIVGGSTPECYDARIFFDGKYIETRKLSGKENEFSCKVPNPKIWSLEKPHLHELEVVLESNGTTADMKSTTFGIRTVNASNGKLYLNGKELFLVGYNRHESHPEFGYATPQFLMLSDLSLIKEQGCNFIRGSHYPQREKFLDLCDRMGILVWEEVIGWNNKKEQFSNKLFFNRQLEAAAAMVRKSANHPSIIFWGFLNEVWMDESPRELISALVKTIKEEDASRLVTFAFATGWIDRGDDCLDLVDVLSFNTYPGWYGGVSENKGIDQIMPKLRSLAEWASKESLREKPLIIGETGGAALYGDHSGYRWSEEYQSELIETTMDEIHNNSRYSGIAIWQFCDTKSYINMQKFTQRPRGFNNKGVVDEYRRPKLAWRKITEILKKWQDHTS